MPASRARPTPLGAALRALVAPALCAAAQAAHLAHGPWPWVATVLLGLLLWAGTAGDTSLRTPCFVAAGALMLALALNAVPGLAPWRLAVSSLNLSKAIAGLSAMAMLPSPWRWTRACTAVAAATLLAVPALAWHIGHVHWAPVTLSTLAGFALRNAVSTVAEEWFFRCWVQQPLQRFSRVAAVLGSAALFGLVHLAGGPVFAGLAGLAGLGYAAVFALSGSVWAAVALHLALNVLRVMLFGLP
jgi:membrane protease YdiL (CAAX protease family)